MIKTSDYSYDLPPSFIAQTPVEPRDMSRLLVLNRKSKNIEHVLFRDIGQFLIPGDLLILNQTRVTPARLFALKDTGGRVEILLLHKETSLTWEVLVGGKGLYKGKKLFLPITGDASYSNASSFPIGVTEETRREADNKNPGIIQAEIITELSGSRRRIRFSEPIEPHFPRLGHIPLPPYIQEELSNPERYQTVYARYPGSAAAPTAGLHFTEKLLDSLRDHGIRLGYVTLHVGLDTFAPITERDATKHVIHSEWCELSQEIVNLIIRTHEEGHRVIAVGTTSVRTLETAANDGGVSPFIGKTRLFITPGHQFRLVDAMITNFHLPRSTLLLLVSAFADRETILGTYRIAMERGYRFYSFGDAMLII